MKVLITDDHELFIDGLQMVLRNIAENVTCLVALSASKARALINENPDIDIALVDLNMPGCDGISLIRDISHSKIGIPSILLSATDEPYRIKAALDAGALGYVSKSASRAELYSAIKAVLGGDVSVPEAMAQKVLAISKSQQRNQITDRQKTVLHLMAKGYQNKQIADSLSLAEDTVKFHIKCLFTAFKSRNRTECVSAARALGLLEN